MPATLSASARAVPYSRIRELAEIAMGMEGVYKLYFGESNLPTPEYIKRAAQKAMADGYTYYTENAGMPSTGKRWRDIIRNCTGSRSMLSVKSWSRRPAYKP